MSDPAKATLEAFVDAFDDVHSRFILNVPSSVSSH